MCYSYTQVSKPANEIETKPKGTKMAKTQEQAPKVEETNPAPTAQAQAPQGITKTVSVYAVKAGEKAVNYPTKARANDAKNTLQLFGIDATIETVKKTVSI